MTTSVRALPREKISRPPLSEAEACTALAGLTSIGLMAIVNFVIASDFRWLILSFGIPWVLALVFYRIEGSDS